MFLVFVVCVLFDEDFLIEFELFGGVFFFLCEIIVFIRLMRNVFVGYVFVYCLGWRFILGCFIREWLFG